jgi:hypothetical protein
MARVIAAEEENQELISLAAACGRLMRSVSCPNAQALFHDLRLAYLEQAEALFTPEEARLAS